MVHQLSQLPLPTEKVNRGYMVASHAAAHKLDKSTFAKRLDFAMSTRGVKAPTLATKLDITRQAIYKWLKGFALDIDGRTLLGLSSYLGVRPEWLLLGEGPMFQSPVLAEDEKEMILLYRDLTPADRAKLRGIASQWVGETTLPPTPHRPYRNNR